MQSRFIFIRILILFVFHQKSSVPAALLDFSYPDRALPLLESHLTCMHLVLLLEVFSLLFFGWDLDAVAVVPVADLHVHRLAPLDLHPIKIRLPVLASTATHLATTFAIAIT